MVNEYEEERVFSENIDRLLAGEEILFDSAAGDDLRTALDFVRKMRELRATPSPQFQSRLKSNLLEKLNEREAREEARRGWFWRLIPREPLWQAVAVLAIMIVVGGVLWSTLFKTTQPVIVNVPTVPPITSVPPIIAAPTTAAPAPSPAPPASMPAATTSPPAATQPASNVYLQADASTNKTVYSTGEKIDITVNLKNIAAQPVTIEEFPPILSLMQTDSKQPVYTFAAGKTAVTLAPGQAVSYHEVWNQTDFKGKNVPSGGYYLELEELYYQGKSVQLNLVKPVIFEILPPGSSNQ